MFPKQSDSNQLSKESHACTQHTQTTKEKQQHETHTLTHMLPHTDTHMITHMLTHTDTDTHIVTHTYTL